MSNLRWWFEGVVIAPIAHPTAFEALIASRPPSYHAMLKNSAGAQLAVERDGVVTLLPIEETATLLMDWAHWCAAQSIPAWPTASEAVRDYFAGDKSLRSKAHGEALGIFYIYNPSWEDDPVFRRKYAVAKAINASETAEIPIWAAYAALYAAKALEIEIMIFGEEFERRAAAALAA